MILDIYTPWARFIYSLGRWRRVIAVGNVPWGFRYFSRSDSAAQLAGITIDNKTEELADVEAHDPPKNTRSRIRRETLKENL